MRVPAWLIRAAEWMLTLDGVDITVSSLSTHLPPQLVRKIMIENIYGGEENLIEENIFCFIVSILEISLFSFPND